MTLQTQSLQWFQPGPVSTSRCFAGAVCNFGAAFLLETKVASTIGNDIVHTQFWILTLSCSDFSAQLSGTCSPGGWIAHKLFTCAGRRFAGAAVAKAGWVALKPEGFLGGSLYCDRSDRGLILGRLMMMLMYFLFESLLHATSIAFSAEASLSPLPFSASAMA